MIPKIIHYCWFGRNPYPEKVQKCIESWKQTLFGYEFMLWNEDNFDIESIDFVSDAYKSKRYAFVSDYVRVYALQTYGGIYLDTDIEVIKTFDDLLNNNIVLGTDDGGYLTALMASVKNQSLWDSVLNHYRNLKYLNNANDNSLVNNTIIQNYLKPYGYKVINKKQLLNSGIVIYPDDYFHAKSLTTGKLHVTKNTFCIHHHTLLWVNKKTKIIKFIRLKILVPLIGKERYAKLVSTIKDHQCKDKQ